MKPIVPRPQSGAILLVVALLLATMAALAFSMNRATGADALSVQDEYEARAAGYLADAAVANARWASQVGGCTSASIPLTALGTGTFSAAVVKAPSKRLNITATGTVNGDTIRTRSVNESNVFDFSKTETKDLGGNVIDTWIDNGAGTVLQSYWQSKIYADSTDIALMSDRYYGLLYWATTDVKNDAQVLSANLILTQNGTGAVTRQVAVQRMMTPWDQKASWTSPTDKTYWTGTDWGNLAFDTVGVGSGSTYTWDVTGLVEGWHKGRLANYGMLLRLVTPNQSVSFYSRDAAAKNRPILRVTSAKAC
ncbi:hypothetical protein IP91_00829 [Pseudoduganella lurida]|uniref:DNRLRE domain-containing protein n=1 Tax=Pseudoduganella lurida TaxID=1036180 RepID=A0A562RMU7_9BURK|nr:DNRLRE domain-containing protein [Pseudoduganella lurida]TWI69756.1 hypothetical protein IP91_00829 [Pseudoduganella lurida]